MVGMTNPVVIVSVCKKYFKLNINVYYLYLKNTQYILAPPLKRYTLASIELSTPYTYITQINITIEKIGEFTNSPNVATSFPKKNWFESGID